MHDIDFGKGLWAVIVYGGGKRIIGSIDDVFTPRLRVLERADSGNMLRVDNAFNFVSELMPVPVGPGQMGMRRICEVAPLDNGLEPATMHVRPEAIRFFDDMTTADREMHQDMIVAVLKQLEEAKKARAAQRSNIVLAGPGDVPRGRTS